MTGLSKRHRKLMRKDGFNELFEREIPRHDTYEEAFQELHRESLVVFGECRYENYESFRKSRARYIRNRQSLN